MSKLVSIVAFSLAASGASAFDPIGVDTLSPLYVTVGNHSSWWSPSYAFTGEAEPQAHLFDRFWGTGLELGLGAHVHKHLDVRVRYQLQMANVAETGSPVW